MVRNCREIGINLQEIVKRLIANQNLLKLLYYTDKNPLLNPDLTEEQIQKQIFQKLIKITPRVDSKETATSVIAISVARGDILEDNSEFKNILIRIETFVPLEQWIMKGSNLRPFAIMGEVQESLQNKKITGLGKIKGGGFQLNFLTEEIGAYEQLFLITVYD